MSIHVSVVADSHRVGSERGSGCARFAELRRRGVELFVVALIVLTSCASSLDFRAYRACRELRGTGLHDPGLVVAEYTTTDEDGNEVRHYTFLPDRLAIEDKRNTIDVAERGTDYRINVACPLITGRTHDDRPVGSFWDTAERPPR
jgi:hypothetical protein